MEEDAAESFINYRKSIKKPITETAAKRLSEKLRFIFVGGGEPKDALAMAEEKGWQSIEPDWYFGSLFGKDSVEYKQAMATIREVIRGDKLMNYDYRIQLLKELENILSSYAVPVHIRNNPDCKIT